MPSAMWGFLEDIVRTRVIVQDRGCATGDQGADRIPCARLHADWASTPRWARWAEENGIERVILARSCPGRRYPRSGEEQGRPGGLRPRRPMLLFLCQCLFSSFAGEGAANRGHAPNLQKFYSLGERQGYC